MADILSEQTALYRSMLQYLEASMTDPERPVHTDAITRHVLRALDLLDFNRRKPDESSGYYSAARMVAMRGTDPLTLLHRAGAAAKAGNLTPELNSEIFDAIWSTPLLSETADAAHLKALITRLTDTIPSPENTAQADRRALALLVTTALTLAAVQYFDSDKLLLLIHAAASEDTALAARAIAGVILITAAHPYRTSIEKEASEALTILADNPAMRKVLQDTMIQIARTRDTDRVTAKISNEIMPKLHNIQSDLQKRFADMQAMNDLTAEEFNPQWEDMLSDSNITKPLEEMSEMQSAGEDVMMAAFGRLKDFGMFRDAAGWFTPFYRTHADLASLTDTDELLLNGLCEARTLLCDSDKYSIAFSLTRIPEGTRRMMNSQLEAQLDAIREQNSAEAAEDFSSLLNTEIMLYLRGMMRFFRLYHGKEGLADPFIFPNPAATGPLTPFLSTPESHDDLGRFYFKNGYWEEAVRELSGDLADKTASDHHKVLSMIGYAYQRMNLLDKALEYYDRAAVASSIPDKWLLRKLAWVNRRLGNHRQAADYYRQLLSGDNDNTSLNTLLANALYDAGNYQEALKLYYKVEFLATDGRRTLRPVAWCELMTGQTDKARDTYSRLLSIEADDPALAAADFMNAGHVEFVSGRYGVALKLYKEGLGMLDSNRDSYMHSLRSDIPVLTRLTGDADTAPRMALMLDRIML